ncbi:MAG TPA: hypothetical protein VD788_09965 [Candidatus Polarisedimenticolaceae bacterium]|nr:hypothetical protein [Candidatus Polarisedimenticolaceae bacterium]
MFKTVLLGMGAWLLAAAAAVAGPCDGAPAADEPRTLILALDGVPFRVVRTVREMGAFEGWGETRPMVSPFPSMTNVGFAAILSPFGAPPIPGYELRRYDRERNVVTGGGIRDSRFAWRKEFDLQQKGLWSKVGLYMAPRRNVTKEMRQLRRFLLDSTDRIVTVLVSSTDPLTHFHGDAATARALLGVAEELELTRRVHRDVTGRELEIVMVSDHGNSPHKVRRADGIKKSLRRAGLRPSKRLVRPDDVITVTYGVVGYGVLYLSPDRAEAAARSIVDSEGVHLAAWRSADGEMRVRSSDGEARIRWRNDGPQRSFAYDVGSGDPLELGVAVERMRRAGVVGTDGFARRDDWFEWTAFERYPDAVVRLVDSLGGAWVSNSATVIFSFEPGFAWGIKAAEVGAWLRAGKLEETHGSLDRASSWGFFLASDPRLDASRAVSAEQALRPWAELSRCRSTALVRLGTAGDGLHAPGHAR